MYARNDIGVDALALERPAVNTAHDRVKTSPAVVFYKGKVMHARMKPVEHRFVYKMSSMLIDLDRLEEADRISPLFSVNKSNLVSFNEKDFGPRDGTPLRKYVDDLAEKCEVAQPARIELLCYPSVFGNGFNPLSVYFCYDHNGELALLIYEVRNTFGEHHTYVEPVREGQAGKAGIRQEAHKKFYVSPFMDMEMRYLFRLRPPGEEIAVRILELDPEGPILAATFHGIRQSFSTGTILATLLQSAGVTWKVVGGIHYEALKLWLRGMKIRPRKPHQGSHSFPDGGNKRAGAKP